jgi:hypothetical protein
MVSLNGVMQSPQDSFTVSGSTITFASALTSSDSIDFIMALGDVLNIGTPSDGTVTAGKIATNAVTAGKIASGAVTKSKIGTTELDLATIKDSTGTNTAMTINSSGLVIPKKIAFQVNSTDTDQAYTANSYTKIQWESVALDTASYWDSGNHRYTPQVAGWYLFGGSVRLNTTSVTLISFIIAKNGDTSDLNRLMGQTQTVSDTFTNGEYPLPTGMMQLNGSTDYVDVRFQSEENCTIHDNTRQSFFWGMLVHPI